MGVSGETGMAAGPIVDRDAVLVPRREESGGAKLMGMGERFPL
jgi:hypothetical protein